MPSLLDAANAFSRLGKQSLETREAACVRVRNRHASCDFCLRVCSHEAITIENNELSVDAALCTGCGACASACPTQALVLLDDAGVRVMEAVDGAATGEVVEVVCEHARNVLAAVGDAAAEPWGEAAVAVPCLAALDETVGVHGACAGVSLSYFSADCAACPNANGALIEDIVAQTEGLLEALDAAQDTGVHLRLSWQMVNTAEEAAAAGARDTSPEMTRRGMFDELVARTTDSVAEAAVHTFYVTQAAPEEKPTLAQTLKDSVDTLKSIESARGAQVLNDLYQLEQRLDALEGLEQAEGFIPTRLFGAVELDAEACDLCGICMTFCPTKALSGIANEPVNPFVAATRERTVSGELDFRANDCVNCELCLDVCPRDALALRSGIALRDLFALDPHVLLKR